LVTAAAGGVVGILALQGAVSAHQSVLDGLGVATALVRTPDDLKGVDAIVLPGGESTTIWMLLKSNGLAEQLERRLHDGMPALGTCAGMILLAADVLDGRSDQGSLGALDVSVRRNAFGRQVASFEADIDVKAMDGPAFPAVFIRAPFVERVGDGVEVLAVVDGHPVAVRQGAVLATAFHPELSGDDRVHAMFVESLAG
jgi:5'-phosphate synthase pdxT subunit